MMRFVYEKLVRVFYSNANNMFQRDEYEETMDHNKSFCIYVVGKELILTPYLLQKLLKLKPTSKDALTQMTKENVVLKEELLMKFMVNLATIVKFPNSPTRLRVNDRILHLIVKSTLRPFGLKITKVTIEKMWYVHHIKKCTPIDLAQFIYRDMETLERGARNNLAYGMAISRC